MKNYKKENVFMLILSRVLAFPFFAGISLVGAFLLWLKWMWNFAKYGGESIVYARKNSRKTIHDIFTKLVEQSENK